jgi:hypothetical protein
VEGGFGDSPENRKGNRRICRLGMKVVNGEKETVPKRGETIKHDLMCVLHFWASAKARN